MPHLLKDIRLEEISLVDAGANPGANILFFKRARPQVVADLRKLFATLKPAATESFAKSMDEVAATFDQVEATDDAWEMLNTLWRSLASILSDASLSTDQKASMIADSLSQYLDAMSSEEADMPDVTKQQMDEAIAKAVAEAIGKNKQETDAAIAKAVADAKAAAEADLQKVRDAAAAEVKKANEELAKLRGERDAEVRLIKAKSMVGKAPITAEEVSKLLAQLDADGTVLLEKVLKATNAALEQADLFKEQGSSYTPERGEAVEELDKAAAAIRKEKPELSEAQAQALAVERNVNLYAEYRKRQMRSAA